MENWKAVPDYEGKYEVSDNGRVRSLDREVWNNFRGGYIHQRGRTMKLKKRPTGHLSVALCKDGKYKTFYVHRLVLLAFVGPCPEGMEACHYDDDPANNTPGNLRWAARSANIQDRIRNGRRCNKKSDTCKRGHPFTSDNTKLLSNGKRTCLTCWRKRQREWKREHRHAR